MPAIVVPAAGFMPTAAVPTAATLVPAATAVPAAAPAMPAAVAPAATAVPAATPVPTSPFMPRLDLIGDRHRQHDCRNGEYLGRTRHRCLYPYRLLGRQNAGIPTGIPQL
jgi:hypothetical protein